MATAAIQATTLLPSPKQQFLDAYEREHATTMKVLRAFPSDQADLKPHPKCKSAKELAWMFVMERAMGTLVLNDGLSQMTGTMPPPPEKFEDVVTTLEQAHQDFGNLVRSFSDDQMLQNVTFLLGPKTPGPVQRLSFVWFLLYDEIHHRGQFSVYLRMADAKVPSIYGPTADEPWL